MRILCECVKLTIEELNRMTKAELIRLAVELGIYNEEEAETIYLSRYTISTKLRIINKLNLK